MLASPTAQMDDIESRILNASNRHQGAYKKVLCVCSAGMLRSPTAALVLSMEPFNFNTRACGIGKEYALIVLDDVLLAWADEIVCMESVVALELKKKTKKTIICLDIQDAFDYRDPSLMDFIKSSYLRYAK